MGCFVVTTAEAVAVSVVKHVRNQHNKKSGISESHKAKTEMKKLSWLNMMLWGGSFLLLIEHIWHGEIVPFFPFFTAMESKEETIALLKEMGTVGVGMAVAVTAVWMVMCLVYDMKESRKAVLE